MKYAVYTATRNAYEKMIPSIKSLLMNSDVDKVYLLIEDDKFPVELPKECECINVSKQQFFRRTNPNNVYPWANMSMMRGALAKVIDADVVLSLDVDTIIDEDISELWDLPLDGYYFAAVPEPDRCKGDRIYTNIGVTMFNLAKLRDGKVDEIIHALNWRRYYILEQDCLNELCAGHILALPSMYNVCEFTAPADRQKIIHYAGIHDWQDAPLVEKYRDIPWEEVRKPVKRRRRNSGVLQDEVTIFE